jgi:lysophospholipase L1-like esterase
MASFGRSYWSVVLLAFAVSSCGGSSTQPSPGVLSLTCPADITKELGPGDPLDVTYAQPTASGGRQPVTVTCAPASGSAFSLGSSTVTCTGTDAGGQSASCSLRVTLTSRRILSAPRILAFGDSITEGFQREPIAPAPTFAPLVVIPTETYPYNLEQLLRARYPEQEVLVFNRGVGGETAAEGRRRIIEEIEDTQADLLLLLEGYNRLTEFSTDSIRDDLRAMARSAQVRDVDVLLATLFQVNDFRERQRPGSQDAISALNVQIRRLTVELKIDPAVDLERAFGDGTSLLGVDGLHPNAAGYRLIAETFFEAITSRFEVDAVTPTPTPAPARSR